MTERAEPSPSQEDGDQPVVFIVDDDASMLTSRRTSQNVVPESEDEQDQV